MESRKSVIQRGEMVLMGFLGFNCRWGSIRRSCGLMQGRVSLSVNREEVDFEVLGVIPQSVTFYGNATTIKCIPV